MAVSASNDLINAQDQNAAYHANTSWAWLWLYPLCEHTCSYIPFSSNIALMTWSPPMTKKDRENLMKHDRTESSVPCTQEMVSHDIASNRSTWPSWLQPGVQSIHHSGARGGHLSALRGGTLCSESEGFVLNLWLLPLFSCGCWFSNQFTFPVYISGKKSIDMK